MSKRRVAIAFALFIAGNVSGQDLVPSSPAPQPAGATAEVERVIVTGSNIPTAEETGPNPVDTYHTEDIQKLGAYTQPTWSRSCHKRWARPSTRTSPMAGTGVSYQTSVVCCPKKPWFWWMENASHRMQTELALTSI